MPNIRKPIKTLEVQMKIIVLASKKYKQAQLWQRDRAKRRRF